MRKFTTTNDAEKVVQAENTWSISTTHMTEDGKKRFYRCNKAKRKGIQCAAQVYLLFEVDSDAVLLFRTASDHNHDYIDNSSNHGICEDTKNEIKKLFELRLKPKEILENLSKMEGVKVPQKRQLYNYLSDLRRIKYGPPSIHLGELKKWILDHLNVPEDVNEPFVIAYHIVEEEPLSFRFALSTKKLLQLACRARTLHADATYKLVWQSFPVLIAGTTDKNRKFHPMCLGVSTNECQADFKMFSTD